jgi:hypothetical protein
VISLLTPFLRQLKVAEMVGEQHPGKEEMNYGTTVMALVLDRLLAPKSLSKISEWLDNTILEDALRVEAEQMGDSYLGCTLDDIHEQLATIVGQVILVYDLDLSFLHYDITSRFNNI